MFINNALTINQNTNIYGEYVNEGTYDYTFNINIKNLVPDMTSLFTNATYIQNSLDANNFNVKLIIPDSANFVNWNTKFNNFNQVNVEIGNSATAFTTLNPSEFQKFGDRLLEVVAHKIFGHGQARAAISNDTEFYTHDAELWDHLVRSVNTVNFGQSIFKQYIAIGRYENNTPNVDAGTGTAVDDINNYINFNFNDLSFDFPLYLNGSILLNNSLTNNEVNLFLNGPNIGGTLLNNGLYNIPILVRFHT